MAISLRVRKNKQIVVPSWFARGGTGPVAPLLDDARPGPRKYAAQELNEARRVLRGS